MSLPYFRSLLRCHLLFKLSPFSQKLTIVPISPVTEPFILLKNRGDKKREFEGRERGHFYSGIANLCHFPRKLINFQCLEMYVRHVVGCY